MLELGPSGVGSGRYHNDISLKSSRALGELSAPLIWRQSERRKKAPRTQNEPEAISLKWQFAIWNDVETVLVMPLPVIVTIIDHHRCRLHDVDDFGIKVELVNQLVNMVEH